LGESGVEAIMREALTRAGIPFAQEVKAGRYRIDFLINSRIALEIDSEFWHSLPGTREKDARKDQFLLSQGFVVVRVNEETVRENVFAIIAALTERMDADGTAGYRAEELHFVR
jgi:very-short-patch-repair endonuclease